MVDNVTTNPEPTPTPTSPVFVSPVPVPVEDDTDKVRAFLAEYWPYLAGGLFVLLLIVIGFTG